MSASVPTITVVTICRNAEAVIDATMVSVLTQRYPGLEYVIVVGESTDHTLDQVWAIAARFPHRPLRVIAEPDDGISDAMNKGVLAATGDVIAHLHAGDRYIDDRVLDHVMASHQLDGWRWAAAESIVVNNRGRAFHTFRPRPEYRRLLKQNFIPHQSVFLVRDVFERHGLFRTDLKQAMDYEFWLRLVFRGGERYHILPFATTYFLDGGKSSQIWELLRHLRLIRRELRVWVPELTLLDDTSFLARVAIFGLYSRLISARLRTP